MKDTRTRIIESAVTIISKNGIEGVSASILANSIGLSKSTIFHHFNSVDEVIVESFNFLINDQFNFNFSKHTSLESILKDLGKSTLFLCKMHTKYLKAFFTYFIKSLHSEEINKLLKESYSIFRNSLYSALNVHIKKTSISKRYADMLISSLDGLSLHFLLFEDEKKFKSSWRITSNSFIKDFNNERLK